MIKLWLILLGLSWLHASAISVLYVFEAYPRHRVESGWLIFAALFAVTALTKLTTQRSVPAVIANRRVFGLVLAAAIAVYAPSLTVGFLSDDYVLLAASNNWQLAPAAWEHFRPLALAIWAVLKDLGIASPVILHTLNIALHGANAYLTYRLGLELGVPVKACLAAGVLFLVFPGSVEPVTWISGLPDVLMATFVLGFLTAALRNKSVLALVFLILATLTKETAVCAPLLLLLFFPRRSINVRLLLVAVAWCISFGLARLYLKPAEELFDPIGGYFLKELVVRIYGGLAMPWTREQMFMYPWWMTMVVLSVAALPALLIFRSADRSLWTTAAIWGAWALVAAIPAFRYLYVSPELQGSRHLYLPAVGWSLLLASFAFEHRKVLGQAALVVLVASGSIGSIMQQMRWRSAADHRDKVLESAIGQVRANDCRHPVFRNGPDSYDGVYVFRNGLTEAVRDVTKGDAGEAADCVFEWSSSTSTFRGGRR